MQLQVVDCMEGESAIGASPTRFLTAGDSRESLFRPFRITSKTFLAFEARVVASPAAFGAIVYRGSVY